MFNHYRDSYEFNIVTTITDFCRDITTIDTIFITIVFYVQLVVQTQQFVLVSVKAKPGVLHYGRLMPHLMLCIMQHVHVVAK